MNLRPVIRQSISSSGDTSIPSSLEKSSPNLCAPPPMTRWLDETREAKGTLTSSNNLHTLLHLRALLDEAGNEIEAFFHSIRLELFKVHETTREVVAATIPAMPPMSSHF